MENFCDLKDLELDPKSANGEKDFLHWKKAFQNFMEAIRKTNKITNSYSVLINIISSDVYQNIAESISNETAVQALDALFIKS